MPWTRGGEDDRRFRKALATSLLLALLLGLLPPLIDLPLPELAAAARDAGAPDAPDSGASAARRRPCAGDRSRSRAKPEPAEKLVAENASPKRGPEEAPEEAPGAKGILAFREQFSGLADDKPVARLGAKARISREGEVASGAPERSLVTTQAPGSSGGINLAALSRGVGGAGGQQLDGVQVARATSSIARRPARRLGPTASAATARRSVAPTKRSRSSSTATRRRSTGSTTASCAATRP